MEKQKNINDYIYLNCSCGAHIMRVGYDKYFFDNGYYNDEWQIACFEYPGSENPNFWHRLKVAFKYLIKGKMHEDQIILDREEINKLAEFIRKTKANYYC